MNTTERVLVGALLGGFGGWLLESISRGHLQWSPAFDRAPIPFIPTYAAGGALLALMAPKLENVPLLGRMAIYGATFTALEYGACQVDRATGNRTWSYGADGACIDVEHTLAWSALGLVGEQVLKAVTDG